VVEERVNGIRNSPGRHGQWDFHSRLSKKERNVKEGQRRTNWNGKQNVQPNPEKEGPRTLGSEHKILFKKNKAYREARLLVFHTHVSRSETHGFDSFIQSHAVYSITCHGELGSRNSLDSYSG